MESENNYDLRFYGWYWPLAEAVSPIKIFGIDYKNMRGPMISFMPSAELAVWALKHKVKIPSGLTWLVLAIPGNPQQRQIHCLYNDTQLCDFNGDNIWDWRRIDEPRLLGNRKISIFLNGEWVPCTKGSMELVETETKQFYRWNQTVGGWEKARSSVRAKIQ